MPTDRCHSLDYPQILNVYGLSRITMFWGAYNVLTVSFECVRVRLLSNNTWSCCSPKLLSSRSLFPFMYGTLVSTRTVPDSDALVHTRSSATGRARTLGKKVVLHYQVPVVFCLSSQLVEWRGVIGRELRASSYPEALLSVWDTPGNVSPSRTKGAFRHSCPLQTFRPSTSQAVRVYSYGTIGCCSSNAPGLPPA